MVEYVAGEEVGAKGFLVLSGEFVGDGPDQGLAKHIEHHYVDDGVSEIVVDLRDVEAITLEGVAILLRLREESAWRGKRFVVEHAHDQVEEKLALTRVLRLLTEA
jgi:anti-anti-sigma regulatory factor